jgi:hypothetical protein
MSLIPYSEIRDVHGISLEQKNRIKCFLHGAVYCWCKNRPDEWFSIRDLMGGENYYWHGTPLQVLFEKHIKKGKSSEEAIKGAGIDAGWLLKRVIDDDIRKFHTSKGGFVKIYLWKH